MRIRAIMGIVILALSAFPLAAQTRLATQTGLAVQSATPADLKLEKGGSATVTLSGTGLGAVTSAQLLVSERMAMDGVGAEIVPLPRPPTPSTTALTIRLSARWDAKEGDGFMLRIVAGGQSVIVPASILKVAVVWPRPQITDSPAEADVGSVITLRGSGLGHAGQSDKTKVVISFGRTHDINPVQGEPQSVTPTELKVRVPNGAYYSRVAVLTPGGQVYTSRWLQPLYIRNFPPDIFQPTGLLGSALRISDSFFAFANGNLNSAFNPSSPMIGLGAAQVPFTFPPKDQRIDLIVGSTIFRVRLKGANRLSAAESLRTTSFGVTVNRTEVVISLTFESDGTEFVGEYETQDILTKKIYWKHCLNLEIDSLKITATLPILTDEKLLNSPWQFLGFGGIKASASFTPRFSILGTPPFTIGEGPIKDFIKAEAERQVTNSLNDQGFKDMFNSYLTTYVRGVYQGTPVVKVKARAASNGGLDWVGRTNY
jgi:hypothetical protein